MEVEGVGVKLHITMMKRLRVVTWNCAMALRRKLREVASLNADVLVLQECSRSDADHLGSIGLELAYWTGSNLHKGLALAARSELQLMANPIRGIQWAIRGITGGDPTLGIVAIWACKSENSEERYVRQIHKLLDRDILETLPQTSIVLGDFNSNSIWDAEHRELSHSRAVEKFELAGYRSAYHHLRGETHGNESTPTFFLYRNSKRSYHIDYSFLSSQMRQHLKKVDIGAHTAWLGLSDHMPFIIEFSCKNRPPPRKGPYGVP